MGLNISINVPSEDEAQAAAERHALTAHLTPAEIEKQYKRDCLYDAAVFAHEAHEADPDKTPVWAKQTLAEEHKRWRQIQVKLLRYKKAIRNKKMMAVATSQAQRKTGHKQRSEGTRSSAASGDGNSDSEPEPEPERNPQQHPLQLLDQSSLADLLCISKKTLQNAYSTAPYTLPESIQIPHARGPRWTIQAVQDWLANRPKHTQKLAPIPQKRKAGRPRIAQVVAKGGAK
ncbi:hypothetical protein [Acidithiobacillus thiooxidans]|uniref:hypothetical protein n=1 Tax=Acidithiobacillus thiooxidans TaxID=930 RepID=UPI001C06CEB5|nr:hypothetical protein [Acidithiobacillus thiooxidans]MBU2843538.1 hypothetical protein [Acidithiobacillus thiooxidans]